MDPRKLIDSVLAELVKCAESRRSKKWSERAQVFGGDDIGISRKPGKSMGIDQFSGV